jgi:hypothetical protein
MMAVDCSKCKESEQVDIFWPARAKVQKAFIFVWQNDAMSALSTFKVFDILF